MVSQRSPLFGLLARVLIAALVLTSLPVPASAFARVDPLRGPIHADGLGSIRRLTDEAGNITDGYTYAAFGELVAHTGTDPQPYAFTGEPLDPNSGWQYHRARWMDPRVGRFTGMDPWEGNPFEPATLHKYFYGASDPLNTIDPSGEEGLPAQITAVSGAVTVALGNFGAQIQGAFARGGPVIGQLWGRLGTWGNLVTRNVLLQYQRYKPAFQVEPEQWINGRRLDFFVKLGNRIAYIEVKYGLPWKRGGQLDRLAGQVEAGLASGARTVLFAVKEPTPAQINLLKERLGLAYYQIEHAYGVEGLWKWLVSFFGPI
jgi:RHS repeat-associated protein